MLKTARFSFKKIAFGFIVLLLVIQVFRIDKTNPPVDVKNDFISTTNAPLAVGQILKTSCYDCHSNETRYPWYTNVAPLSWWVKDHINEGREELNFSEWKNYNAKKADHKLEECIEQIEEGEMPMYSYTLSHSEATLSEAQKKLLIDWFASVRKVE
ncbi:MAG TPA: heme-binding domain-containing protein [Cytophagaceae bacterium]|jgi:hypothetical protein|nr:heme-binding domain-containing protein [Cytophagaceae bacterium]